MPQPIAILGVKHQETTSTRANQFSAIRSIFKSMLVPFVDLTIAHAARPFLFVFPVLVHECAEIGRASFLETLPASIPKLFHKMQIFYHLRIVLEATRVLIFEDRTSVARKSGEEQQKIVFKVEQRIDADGKGLRIDSIVLVERKAR
jgi:hypothetical protein